MSARLHPALIPALLIAAVASLWSAAQPADACGCGIAIEAEVNSEAGLVVASPGREEIILSLDLASSSDERAAVVLPVPGVPEVAAIKRGDPLAYLEEATQPPPEVGSGSDGDDGATAGAAPPVDVIGREEIGGYDVTRLASSDPDALGEWLDENGYEVPDGAKPIFDSYIRQDWKFVAIRLAADSDGRLKPLRVSFDTAIPVYPMKLSQLSSRPVDLTLFTLADGERQVEGLETVWTGPVTALNPPPPPELTNLFKRGSHVTRLEIEDAPPESFDTDLVIEPLTEADAADAAVDEEPPVVEAEPANEQAGEGTDEPAATERPKGVWETLIAFGAILIVWGLILLARRRRRETDPPDDPPTDDPPTDAGAPVVEVEPADEPVPPAAPADTSPGGNKRRGVVEAIAALGAAAVALRLLWPGRRGR